MSDWAKYKRNASNNLVPAKLDSYDLLSLGNSKHFRPLTSFTPFFVNQHLVILVVHFNSFEVYPIFLILLHAYSSYQPVYFDFIFKFVIIFNLCGEQWSLAAVDKSQLNLSQIITFVIFLAIIVLVVYVLESWKESSTSEF